MGPHRRGDRRARRPPGGAALGVAVTAQGLQQLRDLLPVPLAFPYPYAENRWNVSGQGVLQAREVDLLPEAVSVAVDGVAVGVLPLGALTGGEPRLARILARMRWRLASRA